MTRYAIVDASAFHDTARLLHYYAQDLRYKSIFERQPEAKHAHVGPWLLQLPDTTHTQVDGWLRTLELDRPVVAWLASEAVFDGVFDHLERCLDMRRPDGNIALLRFWDGRVLLRLQRILTIEQRLELMGPIQTWRCRLLGENYEVDRNDLVRMEMA